MHKMPMRAYKCVVELTIHEVTAPGIRLANKDDLYLNVCLLGQQRRTRLVPPLFPLKLSDHLIFEKTFKFCREPSDVVNFLNDLHVLIELIQLGRGEKNEVLAWYEMNVKEFLYPTGEASHYYDSPQRDVFMTRSDALPGSISPQIIFCTSTRIDETATPSLDILREYENRFVHDPLIDLSKKESLKKKGKKSKLGFLSESYSNGLQENYANHTISSAIKADYTLPDVKTKLEELNLSVKKTKVVKTAPSVKVAKVCQRTNSLKPFVVRRAEEQLIARKPELHDVLHDGLVLINKSPKRVCGGKKKSRSISASRASLKMSQSLNGSRTNLGESYSEALLNDFDPLDHSQRSRSRSASARSRASRSLSPFRLGNSLNANLAQENYRPIYSRNASASHSRSPSRNRTYDILPDFVDEHNHSDLASTCGVCHDYDIRNQIKTRANRAASAKNSSAILTKNKKRSISRRKKDPLNETQLLNSKDLPHAAFLDHYGANSFREAHETSTHLASSMKKKLNKYPKNQSFSHYAPPCNKQDWQYARYYPWLFNYTEYLRDLEEELYWLKVRSKYLHIN